jgi:hypothetical protein
MMSLDPLLLCRVSSGAFGGTFHFHAVFGSENFNLIRDTFITWGDFAPIRCYFGLQFTENEVVSRLKKPHKVIHQSSVWVHSYILKHFDDGCRNHCRSDSDFGN